MNDVGEWIPVYGPAYPVWAARNEKDEARRDLAHALLLEEGRNRALLARLEQVEQERDAEREKFHRHVEEMIEPKLLTLLQASEARVQELEQERDALGNKLAQERSKPDGTFDQWNRVQELEAALRETEKYAYDCLRDGHPGIPEMTSVQRRLRRALAPDTAESSWQNFSIDDGADTAEER